MPSISALSLRERIRLLKPLTSKISIKASRAGQDAYGELGARSNASKVIFRDVKFDGFEACVCEAKSGADPSKAILYLHGGGYTAGNVRYAAGFGSMLAAAIPQKVLCAAYRLAPEFPFPAAVDDALTAYRSLIGSGLEPKNISFVGESAGGGLIYCLALKLKSLGLPLPGRFAAISPWADLTFSGASYRLNEKADPSLFEPLLRSYAEMYAPGRCSDPLVSPVFGDLSGLGRSIIFAGGDELLLDDARMLADRLTACGCKCDFDLCEGMWHVYPLFACPEASAATDKIRDFLES